MERTIEEILTDWRKAEAERGEGYDPEADALIDRLRREHAEALAELRDEADDLARPPGMSLQIET